MGNSGRWLLIVSLLVVLAVGARAQEDENLKAFLADDSPALLFQVSDLSLQSWNGGVGMMFSASESFHWRIALSPNYITSTSTSTDTAARGSSGSVLSMHLTLAPMWVLSTMGDLALTGGPSVGYGYDRSVEEREASWRYSASKSTRDDHFVSAGGTIGALYALTPAIAMQAEYQVDMRYSLTTSEDSRSPHLDELSQWKIITFGRLSLLIRL